MCPPGHYLKGITGYGGRFANLIASIQCAPIAEPNKLTARGVSTRTTHIGTNTSANIPGIPALNSGCDVGGFVGGIFIRSGWHTDGYSVLCKDAAP